MKLKLQITTKSFSKAPGNRRGSIFAVFDLDKAKTYPENFVCVLPKLTLNSKATSAFMLTFKDQSLPLAKKLLTKALKSEKEPAIKTEIEQRLKALKPKPALKAKCKNCKAVFELKTFGKYQQKICQTCKNKARTNLWINPYKRKKPNNQKKITT